MFARPSTLRVSDVVIRAGIVGLALATGYIHSTLGGLLFTLNAVGYVVAAIAMVIPLALAVRFRWVIRLGLMGYAATTIIGWAIQGPYYSTAYLANVLRVESPNGSEQLGLGGPFTIRWSAGSSQSTIGSVALYVSHTAPITLRAPRL